jgi:hypothetical protein
MTSSDDRPVTTRAVDRIAVDPCGEPVGYSAVRLPEQRELLWHHFIGRRLPCAYTCAAAIRPKYSFTSGTAAYGRTAVVMAFNFR